MTLSKGKPKNTPRNAGGLWLGKALAGVSRLAGRGGTSLPGCMATALAPGLLPFLAAQLPLGSLAVTGTNGKTTSALLLANMLRRAGKRVVHNHSGANLLWGVATAFIGAATCRGKVYRDIGILEADEAAFPGIVKAVRPRGVLITNILRDQLDRYGEVDAIRQMIEAGLREMPPGSLVVLNADDPSVGSMQSPPNARTIYYGLELTLWAPGYSNTGRDVKACPFCGSRLTYSAVYFAHLGRYRCPRCAFRRPSPEVKVVYREAGPAGKNLLTMALPGERIKVSLPLPGLYNVYNALAAAACAWSLGLDSGHIREALEQANPSFGRMEQFAVGDRRVLIGLIKNPVGANEVLRTFLEGEETLHLLIAINDHFADGTDISWLWDVDFEQLEPAAGRIASLTVSGTRAADIAVRLKYAGLPPEKLQVEPNLPAALELSLRAAPADRPLFILPTYTAMLGLRRIIHRRGLAKPFWEE